MSKFLMGAVMMVMLLWLIVSSETSWVSAEDPKEGLIVQGNKLKAMPGYVLKKGANNQVTARRRAGGDHPDHTLTCGCMGATGHCSVGWSDNQAWCFSSESKPCDGKCDWFVGPKTKAGKPEMR